MKFLIAVCLFCFSFAAFGNDTGTPTPADAGTTSVLVSEKAPAPQVEAPKQATVVTVVSAAEDLHVRRRAFGRGYVFVKHTVADGSSSKTREVVDECCNLVRSRTVTKTKCDCCDSKCNNRCNCK